MQTRTITVDYDRPRGYDVGYRNENNITLLALPVPEELSDADSYRVYFESTIGEYLQTEILTPVDGYVTVTLTSDIVPEPGQIAAQLVAFADGDIVGYAPVIYGLAKQSIPDGTDRLSHSLAAEIALNTAARHSHDNKDTLDKLSAADGKLQYNGSDVGLKGDKGATPNIQIGTVETLPAESPATASMTGTPKSPLLNLGIPRGASGSGISVTGATVGQTVRIAAVDENGVPTAWEAVDSEKKWELIDETILAEDVRSVIFSPDGLDQYKELLLMWSLNMSEASSAYVVGNTRNASAYAFTKLTYGNYLGRRGQLRIKKMDGFPGVLVSYSEYKRADALSSHNLHFSNEGGTPTLQENICTECAQFPYTRLIIQVSEQNKHFLSGSLFRLYGVKL